MSTFFLERKLEELEEWAIHEGHEQVDVPAVLGEAVEGQTRSDRDPQPKHGLRESNINKRLMEEKTGKGEGREMGTSRAASMSRHMDGWPAILRKRLAAHSSMPNERVFATVTLRTMPN